MVYDTCLSSFAKKQLDNTMPADDEALPIAIPFQKSTRTSSLFAMISFCFFSLKKEKGKKLTSHRQLSRTTDLLSRLYLYAGANKRRLNNSNDLLRGRFT